MLRVALIIASAGCGRIGFDAAGSDAPGWWNDGWAYRTDLVIDHTRVAGDLADFPVLVELADPALGAHARSDGGDLVFVDAANQQLAYEIERYTASPASLVAWVKVPALSSTTDTPLSLYYGNPVVLAQSQPQAVWSNAFIGVYHFGDGTTLDVHDSAGINDATNNGATASTNAVIGGAVAFSGGPSVDAPTANIDLDPGGLNTVTFWVNYTDAFGKGPVAFTRGAADYDVWFEASGCAGFNTQQGEVLGTTLLGIANRWVYVAAVFYNGVPDPAFNALFIDGARQPLTECAAGMAMSRTVGDTLDWGGNQGYQIVGVIDEGRMANVARPDAWIATEYADQHDPASFVSSGPELARP